MNCRLLGSLLAVVLSSGLAMHGMQQPGERAWLGVAMPSLGVNTPESIYQAAEFPPLPILASQARPASADIKGEEIFQYVRALAAISEQSRQAGEPLWGRIPGRLGDRLTAHYIKSKLDEFGLRDVRIDEVPMPPVWWPLSHLECAGQHGDFGAYGGPSHGSQQTRLYRYPPCPPQNSAQRPAAASLQSPVPP